MIVKICGITREEDALHAVRHGATAVGFVFWPQSPRYIPPARAAAIRRRLPDAVMAVGVFVNQPPVEVRQAAEEAGVTVIQLHGDETPEYVSQVGGAVWRAQSLPPAGTDLPSWPDDVVILLDAHDPTRRGGTGRTIEWARAAVVSAQRRVVLAGGLTPANVEEAIANVRPYGVDVSSGVETAPGVKDCDKVARFVERARAALARLGTASHAR